jgi:hypothetical protein
MNGLRRYGILVPLLFNDGRPVPEALLAQTFDELREKFGLYLVRAEDLNSRPCGRSRASVRDRAAAGQVPSG